MKQIYQSNFNEYIINLFIMELEKKKNAFKKDMSSDDLCDALLKEVKRQGLFDKQQDCINFFITYPEGGYWVWMDTIRDYAVINRKPYEKAYRSNKSVNHKKTRPARFNPFTGSSDFAYLIIGSGFNRITDWLSQQMDMPIFAVNEQIISKAKKILEIN